MRLIRVRSLLLVLSAVCSSAASFSQAVTTPEKFFGLDRKSVV